MDGLLEAKRLRKRIDELQHWRRVGIRTLGEGKLYEQERDRQAALSAAKPLPSSAPGSAAAGATAGATSAPAALNPTPTAAAAAKETSAGPRLSSPLSFSPAAATGGQEAAAAVAAATGLSDDVAWLQKQPGHELLSPEERKLCGQLRLRPDHYQLAKDALVRLIVKSDCHQGRREIAVFHFFRSGRKPRMLKEISGCSRYYSFLTECLSYVRISS